jgi:hypothetical protein
MCFRAWETGKRQYYDPVKKEISDTPRPSPAAPKTSA